MLGHLLEEVAPPTGGASYTLPTLDIFCPWFTKMHGELGMGVLYHLHELEL